MPHLRHVSTEAPSTRRSPVPDAATAALRPARTSLAEGTRLGRWTTIEAAQSGSSRFRVRVQGPLGRGLAVVAVDVHGATSVRTQGWWLRTHARRGLPPVLDTGTTDDGLPY